LQNIELAKISQRVRWLFHLRAIRAWRSNSVEFRPKQR